MMLLDWIVDRSQILLFKAGYTYNRLLKRKSHELNWFLSRGDVSVSRQCNRPSGRRFIKEYGN